MIRHLIYLCLLCYLLYYFLKEKLRVIHISYKMFHHEIWTGGVEETQERQRRGWQGSQIGRLPKDKGQEERKRVLSPGAAPQPSLCVLAG